jgi:hypothetical protein
MSYEPPPFNGEQTQLSAISRGKRKEAKNRKERPTRKEGLGTKDHPWLLDVKEAERLLDSRIRI